MAASVQFRPQNRDLGMVMREVDEDLAIFLGMRNSEKDKNGHFLVQESDEYDVSKGAEEKPDGLMSLNPSQAEIVSDDEKLLNLENEKSDYNWLLMQPDSSSLPSLDVEVQDSAANQTEISNDRHISSKDEVENSCKEHASMNDSSSSSADSSAASNRRPLSSENRKPASKAAKSKPSHASTPTSRSILPTKSMAAQGRSSTTSCVPTPASRPSAPVVSKSSSRSSTPTRKPATPSTTWKGAPSRGTSPSVRSRQSKPSQILSSSHDATQNPRISMPKRAASASRTRSSSHTEKPRQKSCSPTKVRAPISTGNKPGSKILTKSRGSGNDGDDVNPVIMGTKMVDRVVNMRKLAPPKRDECVSHDNHRKSSQENSGFGRSLSKKSLDMALRHMDIRLSIPDKVRPIAKGVSSFAKINTNGV